MNSQDCGIENRYDCADTDGVSEKKVWVSDLNDDENTVQSNEAKAGLFPVILVYQKYYCPHCGDRFERFENLYQEH